MGRTSPTYLQRALKSGSLYSYIPSPSQRPRTKLPAEQNQAIEHNIYEIRTLLARLVCVLHHAVAVLLAVHHRAFVHTAIPVHPSNNMRSPTQLATSSNLLTET